MAQSTTNLGKIHVFPSETLYNQFKGIIADNDLALLKDDGAYIVAALLEQNGYVKFSNGLMLQWGVVAIGRDATVTITMPIASTPINIQVTGTGLSSNIPSAYRTKNIARGFFDIQVAAWESDYFWLALCKN